MKKVVPILSLTLLICFFGGCQFISNVFKYKSKTRDFVNDVIQQKYDQAISLMDIGDAQNVNADTLKAKLANFRKVIIENFGEKIDYTYISAKKTFSTNSAENTPPGKTLVYIEISNTENYGDLKLLFDDNSLKIESLNIVNKEPIPGMFTFWLFGLLTCCILAFNIYMLVQVKRSSINKKWVKYLLIIVLNVPTIVFAPGNNMNFDLLSFQFLLGVSFNFGGYSDSIFAFGLPIGSLIVWYQLKKWVRAIRVQESSDIQSDSVNNNEETLPPENS